MLRSDRGQGVSIASSPGSKQVGSMSGGVRERKWELIKFPPCIPWCFHGYSKHKERKKPVLVRRVDAMGTAGF